MYGTPDDCPDGFEVLFDYKKVLRDFKNGLNKSIPDAYEGTVTALVISADEKKRDVDKSLCVKDLPPCPVSVFQAGRESTVYMADPADPLFEHRALDANFGYDGANKDEANKDEANKRVRGQHVVDFGADFNAAWEAQKHNPDDNQFEGYRLSANLEYWRIAAPGRDKPFVNKDATVGDHDPFVYMHPDRCVDAVAEPDPPVDPSDYSKCALEKPEPIRDLGDGAPPHLPYDKMAFVFETTAEPAVSMCVRFARKACPPGTLLTDVPQRFTLAAVPSDGADPVEVPDPDAVGPVYVVEPVGEVEFQRRCRSLVRRTWTCPDGGYEPLNQFNRCSKPPPPPPQPAADPSEPCGQTEGSTARKEAFEGFFGAAECDDYVRGNFAADPPACSTFGFADPTYAGLDANDTFKKNKSNNPYRKVSHYLDNESTTVLAAVDVGVRHWCKFKAALLDEDCHGDKRPDKLDGCGLNPSSDRYSPGESVCLITVADSGGCVGIVHAIECLAVAAAIDANSKSLGEEESENPQDQDTIGKRRSLGAALGAWQDYLDCAPCADSLFDAVSDCDASAKAPAPVAVDQQIKDWFRAYVYGRDGLGARILESAEIQGALFNLGKENALRPLGYPAADRPPCPNNKHNRWNLPTSLALQNYILENIAYKWPAWLRSDTWREKGLQPPTGLRELAQFLDALDNDKEWLAKNRRELNEYADYEDRHYNSNPTERPAACFDLSSAAGGCRVPFSGSLSHWSPNGTGVALSNMRTDIRVRDLPYVDLVGSVKEQEKRRWKPEQLQNGGPQSVFVPAGPDDAIKSAAFAEAKNVECDFASNTPHVELVVTEMWPDQQLDRDEDGYIDADREFIDEFRRLFGDESLAWWGLTCEARYGAGDTVSDCGAKKPDESAYLSQVKQFCEPDWWVDDCRERQTALQGLRYLPRLDGEDLDDDSKRVEIVRRQERVRCTIAPDAGDGELDVSCPWQPSRAGYFRIAAVAVWQIKHCLNAPGTTDCVVTNVAHVPYGAMGAVTVSEPLGVVVYSAVSEGRSVEPETNLNFGS